MPQPEELETVMKLEASHVGYGVGTVTVGYAENSIVIDSKRKREV
jgi:hypothetical protein